MSSQDIKIKVKTLPEGSYELDIQNTISVDVLKDRLQELTSIQKNRQRLIYRGRALQDTQTIQEAGIEDGHVLHLVERPDNAPPPTATNDQQNQQQNQQSRTGRGGQRVTINQFNLGGDQQPIQLGPGDDVGQVIGNLIQRLIPNANQGDVQIQMDNLQNFNLQGVGPDGQRPQIVTTINSYIDTLSGQNPPQGLVPPLPVPLAINQRLSPTRRIQHLSRAIEAILHSQDVPEYLQTMIQQGITYRHTRSRRTDPGTQTGHEAQPQTNAQPQSIPTTSPLSDAFPSLSTQPPPINPNNQSTGAAQGQPNQNVNTNAQAGTISIDPQQITQALNQALGGTGQSAVDVEMNLGQDQAAQTQAQQAIIDQVMNQVEQQIDNEQINAEQEANQSTEAQTGDNQNSQNQSTQTGQQGQRSGRSRRQNLAYPFMPLITYAVTYLLNRTQNIVGDRFVPSLAEQIRSLQALVPETDNQGDRVRENVHSLASLLYNYSTLIFEMARLCSSLHRALEGHGDSIMENLTTVIRQDGSRPVVDTFRDYQDTTIPIAATVTQNITMPSGDTNTDINLGQPRAGAGAQGQANATPGMQEGATQQQPGAQQGNQQRAGNRQTNDVESLVQTMMQNIDLGGAQLGNLGQGLNRAQQQSAGANVQTSQGQTFTAPPNADGPPPYQSQSRSTQQTNTQNQQQSQNQQYQPGGQTQGQNQAQGQGTGQESRRGTSEGQGPNRGSEQGARGQRPRRPRRRRNSNTQTFNISGDGNFDLGNLNIPGLSMDQLPQEIQNLISGSGIQIVPEVTSVTVEAGDDFGEDFDEQSDDEDWEDVNEDFEDPQDPDAQQTNAQQANTQQENRGTTQQTQSDRASTSNVSNNLFNTYHSMGNTIIQILQSFFPAVINMVNRHGQQVGDQSLQHLQAQQVNNLFQGFVSEVTSQLNSRQSEFEQQTRPYVEQNINRPQDVIDAISRGLPFLERNVVDFINTYIGQNQTQQQQSNFRDQPMDTDTQEKIPEVQKEGSQSSIPKSTGGIGKLPKRGQASKPKSGEKDQDKKAKVDTQASKQSGESKPKSAEEMTNLMNAFLGSQAGSSKQEQPSTQQQKTQSSAQTQQEPTQPKQEKKETKQDSQRQSQDEQQQQRQQQSQQQQQQQQPNLGNLLNSFGPMLQNLMGGQQSQGQGQGMGQGQGQAGPRGGPNMGGLNLNNLLSDPNIGNMVNSMMPQVQQMMGGGNFDLSGILGGMGGRPPASGQQQRSYAQSSNNQPIVEEPSDDEDYGNEQVEDWINQVGQEDRTRWQRIIQNDRRAMNDQEYHQGKEFSDNYMKGNGKSKAKDIL